MSKIIIYDNKNFLIADLEGKVERRLINEETIEKDYAVIKKYECIAKFGEFRIIHSISLKKQLKKIERIFKYHKEKKNVKKNL